MSAHVESTIARYFRGEVETVAERDALFAHLRGCEACRATFEAQSEAHRALTGHSFSRLELGAALPAVLDAVEPARRRAWLPTWVWGLTAAAAAAVLILSLAPAGPWWSREPELGVKGGAAAVLPWVQVLCFDESLAVTAELKSNGACRAPGYLKVSYPRPETVEALTVVVLAGDEVRLHATVRRPSMGALLEGHARLAPGESLRVIAVPGEAAVSLDVAKTAVPVLTVRAEP